MKLFYILLLIVISSFIPLNKQYNFRKLPIFYLLKTNDSTASVKNIINNFFKANKIDVLTNSDCQVYQKRLFQSFSLEEMNRMHITSKEEMLSYMENQPSMYMFLNLTVWLGKNDSTNQTLDSLNFNSYTYPAITKSVREGKILKDIFKNMTTKDAVERLLSSFSS